MARPPARRATILPASLEEVAPAPMQAHLPEVVDAVARRVRQRCAGGELVWATVSAPVEPRSGLCCVVRAWFVVPAEAMLGLKAWRDLDEGVLQCPGGRVAWQAHEVGRGLRQLTRQSHGMLEMLGGAPLLGGASSAGVVGAGEVAGERGAAGAVVEGLSSSSQWEALRALLPGALNAQAPVSYEQVSRGLLTRGDEGAARHHALVGWRLCVEGALSPGAAAIGEWARSQSVEAPSAAQCLAAWLEPRRASQRGEGALPSRPSSYDALSGALARLRLAFHGSSC